MKTLRLILRDRISATAIAMLLAYLLLLQGLLSGTSQGTIAAPAVDPLHAICFSSGSVGQATDDESPAKKSIDCRCGMLCCLASTDMPAIVGGEDPVAFAALEVAIGAAILFEEVASLPLCRLIAEPRAPPLFS